MFKGNSGNSTKPISDDRDYSMMDDGTPEEAAKPSIGSSSWAKCLDKLFCSSSDPTPQPKALPPKREVFEDDTGPAKLLASCCPCCSPNCCLSQEEKATIKQKPEVKRPLANKRGIRVEMSRMEKEQRAHQTIEDSEEKGGQTQSKKERPRINYSNLDGRDSSTAPTELNSKQQAKKLLRSWCGSWPCCPITESLASRKGEQQPDAESLESNNEESQSERDSSREKYASM